eukprot:1307081-Alexandrium_andersonii.AAC.1
MGDVKKRRQNRDNIERLFMKTTSLGQVPVIISMDLNEDPVSCTALQEALATGLRVDAAAGWTSP